MATKETSLQAIQFQIKKLQQKAQAVRQRERTPVLKSIVRHMLAFGITPEEMLEAYEKYKDYKYLPAQPLTPSKRKKYTSKPKYYDPITKTYWSGRGKTPRWMVAYLDQGRTKEEFLISSKN